MTTSTKELTKIDRMIQVLLHQGYRVIIHTEKGADDLRINYDEFHIVIWGDDKYQIWALEEAYRQITGHDYCLADYREVADADD